MKDNLQHYLNEKGFVATSLPNELAINISSIETGKVVSTILPSILSGKTFEDQKGIINSALGI